MANVPITDVAQNILKPYINAQDKAYAANIAPVETSPATSAHTAGTQIIYNGVLYTVTANIAANDPLATTGAGANIAVADNVTEQISSQKQALANEAVTRSTLGAKNLLPHNCTSQTTNNITFTLNDDGTVSVSTTSEGASQSTAFNYYYALNDLPLTLGERYILNGCPSNGSGSTFKLDILHLQGETPTDYGTNSSSNEFTYNGKDSSYNDILVRIVIYSGQILTTPITFKPMIRLASDSDATYQPYAMTNKELTDAITPLLPKSSGNGTTVVTPETGWDCYNVWVERSGNVVHIGGSAQYNSDIPVSTETKIFTLKDTSLAPKGNERVISGCGTDAWKTYQPCYVLMGTSGSVYVELPTGTTADVVNFNLTYII